MGHWVGRSLCIDVSLCRWAIVQAGRCVGRPLCGQAIVWAGRCVGRSLCGQVVVCAGRCVVRSLCGQVVVWAGRCVGRLLCGQVVVWVGRCVGRSLCGQVVVWVGRCVGGSLCGQVVVWAGCCVGRSLYGQTITWRFHYPILQSYLRHQASAAFYMSYAKRAQPSIGSYPCSDSRDMMNGHRLRVFSMQYHPNDPHMLVSGGWDDTVQVSLSFYVHWWRQLSVHWQLSTFPISSILPVLSFPLFF